MKVLRTKNEDFLTFITQEVKTLLRTNIMILQNITHGKRFKKIIKSLMKFKHLQQEP